MIGSVSNYSSCISPGSSTTSTTRNQQFQKELLAKLDSNGDGAIDKNELKNALSQDSDNRLLSKLSKNFNTLDTDGNGNLSSSEIAAAMAPAPSSAQNQAPDTQLADALLSALDSNGNGSISSSELTSALQASNSSSSSADISTALLKALDTDGSGSVSSDELKAALQASSNQNNNARSIQDNVAEALSKMIVGLNTQYQLNNATTGAGSVAA